MSSNKVTTKLQKTLKNNILIYFYNLHALVFKYNINSKFLCRKMDQYIGTELKLKTTHDTKK